MSCPRDARTQSGRVPRCAIASARASTTSPSATTRHQPHVRVQEARRHSTSREEYVKDGMVHFVSGESSKGEPAALMVGILTMDSDDVVPPLLQPVAASSSSRVTGMRTAAMTRSSPSATSRAPTGREPGRNWAGARTWSRRRPGHCSGRTAGRAAPCCALGRAAIRPKPLMPTRSAIRTLGWSGSQAGGVLLTRAEVPRWST